MNTKTILVVDDSKDFIFLLSSLLKFHSIKVDGTASADVALQYCRERAYSMIITDYIMDQKNGLELAQEIRSGGQNAQVPMILITSKTLESDEMVVLNRLGMTYIKKPVMPNELYRKITDLLGRKT